MLEESGGRDAEAHKRPEAGAAAAERTTGSAVQELLDPEDPVPQPEGRKQILQEIKRKA